MVQRTHTEQIIVGTEWPQLSGPRREDRQQEGSQYLSVILNPVLLGRACGKRPRAAAPPLTVPQMLHENYF